MSGNRKAPPKSTKYATSATNLQIGPYVISKRSKIHVFACIHFGLDPRQTPSCEACHRSSPGGRRATKGRRWAGSPPSPRRAPSPHGEPPHPTESPLTPRRAPAAPQDSPPIPTLCRPGPRLSWEAAGSALPIAPGHLWKQSFHKHPSVCKQNHCFGISFVSLNAPEHV